MFARELELGTEVAVRNNVAVVMCDLCVRYTNLVDHYIPNLSACLRDDEPVVREQTLIMLTGLLQVLLRLLNLQPVVDTIDCGSDINSSTRKSLCIHSPSSIVLKQVEIKKILISW